MRYKIHSFASSLSPECDLFQYNIFRSKCKEFICKTYRASIDFVDMKQKPYGFYEALATLA